MHNCISASSGRQQVGSVLTRTVIKVIQSVKKSLLFLVTVHFILCFHAQIKNVYMLQGRVHSLCLKMILK